VIPFVLRVTQLVLTICTGFANTLLPRRPPVFLEGKPIDAADTVSALSKYSFTWCAPLLRLATKKGTLDLEDLPRPDHKIRAEELTKNWNYANRSGKLWRRIFLAHKWAFILQWMLTLMQAFGNFAPQFALLHLLRILEKRQMGTSISSEAWIWVLALGLSTVVASWIESWLFWVSQADLALPVRAELASLIFRKAMRRKDVKGATKTMNDANNRMGVTPTNDSDGEEVSKEALTKQSTINLIGVDARRCGDFCSFNNYFPGSVFKLVISFSFLLTLIGWQSLLAGVGTMIIIFPINIFFSRRYAAAQGRLMKVRDEKLGVVTEALQGLRQLKFMGIEQQWQDKILGVRAQELVELWESDKADAMLVFCWIASPILFSATSLAVYATINGELTPSIAFTAIGVFKQVRE
jgi:ABC-type multidrug transport system fused ATPase/permease subunit